MSCMRHFSSVLQDLDPDNPIKPVEALSDVAQRVSGCSCLQFYGQFSFLLMVFFTISRLGAYDCILGSSKISGLSWLCIIRVTMQNKPTHKVPAPKCKPAGHVLQMSGRWLYPISLAIFINTLPEASPILIIMQACSVNCPATRQSWPGISLLAAAWQHSSTMMTTGVCWHRLAQDISDVLSNPFGRLATSFT